MKGKEAHIHFALFYCIEISLRLLVITDRRTIVFLSRIKINKLRTKNKQTKKQPPKQYTEGESNWIIRRIEKLPLTSHFLWLQNPDPERNFLRAIKNTLHRNNKKTFLSSNLSVLKIWRKSLNKTLSVKPTQPESNNFFALATKIFANSSTELTHSHGKFKGCLLLPSPASFPPERAILGLWT